jgi:hypothetical protein
MTKDASSSAKKLPSLRSNPVLASEDRAELARVRDEFFREVRPADFIERMYANEFVELYFEARKLRRAKAELVNSSRTLALKDVLVLGKGEMYGGMPSGLERYSRPKRLSVTGHNSSTSEVM